MISRIFGSPVPTWTLALAAGLLGVASSFTQAAPQNAIAALKAVKGGESYEILVSSSEPFLRSDVPVLRVGDQEITISRAPDDGSSDRRIFILTADQFRKAKSGDKVAFQWGVGEGKRQIDLGSLDKAQLQK